jgi:hypothetical protein
VARSFQVPTTATWACPRTDSDLFAGILNKCSWAEFLIGCRFPSMFWRRQQQDRRVSQFHESSASDRLYWSASYFRSDCLPQNELQALASTDYCKTSTKLATALILPSRGRICVRQTGNSHRVRNSACNCLIFQPCGVIQRAALTINKRYTSHILFDTRDTKHTEVMDKVTVGDGRFNMANETISLQNRPIVHCSLRGHR